MTLKESSSHHGTHIPSAWDNLRFNRFGGELSEQEYTFQHEVQPAGRGVESAVTSTSTVKVIARPSPSRSGGLLFDVVVKTIATGAETPVAHTFTSVPAELSGPNELSSTIGNQKLRTTIVAQVAPNTRSPPSNSNTERLHIFHAGTRTTLIRPPPSWLLSLAGDVSNAAKGKGIRAPMPSVVVDVKVQVGDAVTKGQAIIILESMKTETVLRAEGDGTVKAVACKKGEMVEEGYELVVFEDSQEAEASSS